MARLPTAREVAAQAAQVAARVDKLWADLHSAETAAAVFADLEVIAQASLSPWRRLRITEALLGYREKITIESALEDKLLDTAQKLVRRVRRDITDLKKCRDQYEGQLLKGRSRSAEAGRECLAAYESAREGLDALHSLAGYDESSPHGRLAKVANATWEAWWAVSPPFRYAKCEAALSIVDDLLTGWAAATASPSKGQTWRSKVLNGLVERLEEIFKDITGRSPKGRSGFRSFVKRILKALPPDIYKHNVVTGAALPARIRRLVTDSVD